MEKGVLWEEECLEFLGSSMPKVILAKVVQASHDCDTMKTTGQDESLLLFV